MIAKAFPTTPLLFSIGNNDLMVHNQAPSQSSQAAYYQELKQIFFDEVQANAEIDTSDFLDGGYFSHTIGNV
jgi:hypothetical protein